MAEVTSRHTRGRRGRPLVVFCSSEVAPFSKTGGLGEVSGSLPKALARIGFDIAVFTPFYRCVREVSAPEDTGILLRIPIGNNVYEGRVLRDVLPDSDIPVYFVANNHFYDRAGIYSEHADNYGDNLARFVFFSRSVMEAIEALGLRPDVLHANDWQTALVPVYLRRLYRYASDAFECGTVFTIHSLAFQGRFWHIDMPLLGLGWDIFNPDELEYYGDINLLKAGIVFSDAINTVSPQYARDIQRHEHGGGLDAVLRSRASDLTGIMNGIDYDVWNPGTDRHLGEKFTRAKLAGKGECKRALQQEMGLAIDPGAPLVVIVSRLAHEKGMALVLTAFDEIMSLGLQLAILGTGDPHLEYWLSERARHYQGRASVYCGYSTPLSHRMYAGADMLLMPSLVEPCGLSQMNGLRYGAIPIVRATGGLVDTVTDYSANALSNGKATGFTFAGFDSYALVEALRRALAAFRDKKSWRKLVQIGMKQDFSWKNSARQYGLLYQKVMKR